MIRKILKITLFVLLGLVAVAFAAPFLFKKQILNMVKKEVNKSLDAKVDFKDVDISFLRHFPRAAVGVERVQVIGKDEFAKDTLISAARIDIAVDIMSIIKGSNYNVYSVSIHQPRIHAMINKDGKTNWDIVKPDTALTTVSKQEKPFQLQLKSYEITDGYITYADVPGNMSSEIKNITHKGSGDFTSDVFILTTKTKADAVNFTYGTIPYLNNVKAEIDADVEVDNKTSTYKFKTDEILLNELKLSTAGFLRMAENGDYQMDIKYNAPSTDFRHLLSMVPAVYRQNFDKIKTRGNASFNGFVKGIYNASQLPAYQVNLDVKDGFFQYPDLPKPVKNIRLQMKIDNADGVTNNTVIEIPKGHIEFGDDPFDFHFIFKNPLTSKFLDAGAKGKLDLASVTQFVKLAAETKLSGLLDADVNVKGSLASLEQQKTDFSGKGCLSISNLYYASKDFPQPIQNTNVKIIIDNPDGVSDHTVISIPAAHVEVGSDKADITLLLKNPTTDPYFDGTVKGGFDLSKVKQFYTFEQGAGLSGKVDADIAFKGRKSMIDKKQYEAVQTSGKVNAANVNYTSKDYPEGARVKTAVLDFNPKNITVSGLNGSFMKTNFNGNGFISNAIGYVLRNEPLSGTFTLNADKVDLNKWMGTESSSSGSTAATAPFAVPANLNMTLNATVGNVLYDKVDYSNVTGSLLVANETITLTNVRANALEGVMIINGYYSTKLSKANPDIALSYDFQNLNVQKTFLAYNTVQKLMPIAQFLDGKLSSKMSLTGKLGQDMYPQMNSLTGSGNILLLEGVFKKFAPLEKLAELVDVRELKDLTLKDVKNYITFINGKVEVKPFKLKVQDIEMEIGGMHGFDQTMQYVINMKVPRAMIGPKGNAMVNNLITQVNNKGVPVKVSDIVNLHVKMGGTIKNPVLTTDLKQSASSLAAELKQEAKELVKAKVDSTKTAVTNAVKDTVKAVKNQVIAAVKDELIKKINPADSTKQGNNIGDTKKKAEQSAKDLIKGINPFKKKKKQTDSIP
jgi:hypothetical protein